MKPAIKKTYLWFFAKEPQFVLGSAHGVFGVGPRPRAPVSVSLSFGCVADGSVRTRPAQVLAEVLEGEVARRLKAGLEGLHHDGRVLAGRRTEEVTKTLGV